MAFPLASLRRGSSVTETSVVPSDFMYTTASETRLE